MGNVYTYDEVKSACLEYFKGDELASDVWMSKYAVKTGDGGFKEKTPEDMHRRMAKEFARKDLENRSLEKDRDEKELSVYGRTRKDLNEDLIYDLFKEFKHIIPQGSVMSVLGNDGAIGSLSNCVVLPKVFDSYGGICYSDQQLTQLMKRRCGVGIDISTLRPENSSVSNSAKSSTGAVSFMERFSNTTREVAQSGRRGALMITIHIKHPDAEKFATIKKDLQKVTGANISLFIDDEFMTAVNNDDEYVQKWPIDSDTPEVTKTLRARELWDTIVSCAHASAEPGLIFWDRQHKYSTSSVYKEYENISVNPCAEISMGNDSCRLICQNLLSCVIEPFTPGARINTELLYKMSYETQYLCDTLIDLELEYVERIMEKIKSDPEPDYIKKIELETWKTLYDAGKNGRRTGSGYTGLGDMMAALNLKYDSDEALKEMEHIFEIKCVAEFDCSIDLAMKRGSFVGFDTSTEETSDFVQMMKTNLPDIYARMMKHGRRNVSLSTVAPTGSLSILSQTTSGIEPAYMLSYTRRKKINPSDEGTVVSFVDDLGDKWQEFTVHHNGVKRWMGINNEQDIEKSPYWGATAPEINWIRRVEIQAASQKFCTHSISSTINLPSDVSIDEVKNIYMKSWEMGLKGITVYRDGCRSGVLVSDETKESQKNIDEIKEAPSAKRPELLACDIHYSTVKGDSHIILVGFLKGKPYEVFGGKDNKIEIPSKYRSGWIIKNGKNKKGIRTYDLYLGSDVEEPDIIIKNISSQFTSRPNSCTRLVSTMLRHGVPIKYVCEQLYKDYVHNMFCFERAMARVLKKYIGDGESSANRCPSCGEKSLIYEEGCNKCISCGYAGCA